MVLCTKSKGSLKDTHVNFHDVEFDGFLGVLDLPTTRLVSSAIFELCRIWRAKYRSDKTTANAPMTSSIAPIASQFIDLL